jgi:hypothetical protein
LLKNYITDDCFPIANDAFCYDALPFPSFSLKRRELIHLSALSGHPKAAHADGFLHEGGGGGETNLTDERERRGATTIVGAVEKEKRANLFPSFSSPFSSSSPSSF